MSDRFPAAVSPACAFAGFSLIELMITLVIAAMISAVAIPSYRDHMLRSRIPAATSGLVLTAMRLDHYYQDHRSYANGRLCGVSLPNDSHFAFRCAVGDDGQSFELTAEGQRGGAMQGFAFTLDQLGNQRTLALPEAWGKAPMNCWVHRRASTC